MSEASVDFAARQFLVSEPFRNQFVADERLDDIPFGRSQCVRPGNEHCNDD